MFSDNRPKVCKQCKALLPDGWWKCPNCGFCLNKEDEE